jgi:IgGFc binding protein
MRTNLHTLSLGLGLFLPALLAGACSAAGSSNTFDSAPGGDSPDQAPPGDDLGGGVDDDDSLGGGATDPTEQSGDPQSCAEAAQLNSYIGCDFWPTVTANNVWSIFDYAVVVANAGSEPATITVTRDGASVASAEIPPNNLSKIYLPWVPALKGPDADTCGSSVPLGGSVRANGGAYHLVSSRPVTVYQFNALEYQGKGGPAGKSWSSCPGDQFCFSNFGPVGCFSFSNDASLLLPSTALTGNYRVTGQHGQNTIGGYVAVTGTKDGTEVTVKVAQGGTVVAGGGIPATNGGGTFTFSLDEGDVVEVLGDPSSDLSGSLITATAPVQVISGMSCAQSPVGTQACDHIEESVFPAETLGKHYFVTVPTSPGGKVVGHVVRIYGNVDGTTLTYPSGQPTGAPTTINAGQVVELGRVNSDFEIVGSREFAVASFMLGAAIVDPQPLPQGDQKGDPSQSLAIAVEQYRTKYVFLAPNDYDESYVDVVMPVDAKLTLDGAQVDAAAQPIGSGFGIARLPLRASASDTGSHVLTATAPVGIQVLGYGSYTSYQYPGGLDLRPIAPPPPR